jgi:hypothetical protein
MQATRMPEAAACDVRESDEMNEEVQEASQKARPETRRGG